MFDKIAPDRWIAAMKNFAYHDVEFYMWGGEPFCIEGTYDLLAGMTDYDFVKWGRVDSNITYAKKILKRCRSSKIKILAAWHTETLGYERFNEYVVELHEAGMVGMINFVASPSNLQYLKTHGLDLDELILDYGKKGIFFNVAADFHRMDDPGYKEWVLQYMTPQDWAHIHGEIPSKGVPCVAGKTFFTVEHDGHLTSCGRRVKKIMGGLKNETVGNFFTGQLERKEKICPNEKCLSVISYVHRKDNEMPYLRHLEGYCDRTRRHRNESVDLRCAACA
jgi:hypothetical protein